MKKRFKSKKYLVYYRFKKEDMKIVDSLYLNILKYNSDSVKTKSRDNIRRINLVR